LDNPPSGPGRDGFYEQAYVSRNTPWDSGVPSAELVRVLDAGLLPGKTVLELGCGTGTNAIEFARRGYEVTAADLSPTAIRRAKSKARSAGVAIDFRQGDILELDLGGPYDVLFDRGVYHGIREVNLADFQQALRRFTRAGSRWLCLAGNAKERGGEGPPVVTEAEFRSELGPLFEFLEVREFRFTLSRKGIRSLAWSILMRRK
jgi:cyclopropane fatty-acyl-phospholipid synthase-like methyltransferase